MASVRWEDYTDDAPLPPVPYAQWAPRGVRACADGFLRDVDGVCEVIVAACARRDAAMKDLVQRIRKKAVAKPVHCHEAVCAVLRRHNAASEAFLSVCSKCLSVVGELGFTPEDTPLAQLALLRVEPEFEPVLDRIYAIARNPRRRREAEEIKAATRSIFCEYWLATSQCMERVLRPAMTAHKVLVAYKQDFDAAYLT